MKTTWNDIKEKYLEFHKMDSFTENMAIDIDFGYWLMQEHASQQKPVSDENIDLIAKKRIKELQGLKKYARDQFTVGLIESQIKYWSELNLCQQQKPVPSDEEVKAKANSMSERTDSKGNTHVQEDYYDGWMDCFEWLRDNYQPQKLMPSDEDEITFERLPDNSCIITVKGINELGEEYIRQSTIAYPIYCALINRLESNNSQQKQPKQIDWEKMESKYIASILLDIGAELTKREYSTASEDFIKAAIELMNGLNQN